MLPELTRHDLAAPLAKAAAKLLDGAEISAPPVDAFAVADACGLAVLLQQAHDTDSTERRDHQGLAMRAWAIHEPDWKREILSTKLPDADFEDCG